MASDPRVSVVVPARNEAAALPATLRSLERQATDVPYEVFVVDGDSEDATADVARGAGARVVDGTGAGRAAGRNLGAAAAGGEWLAFVDADTRVRSDYLATLLPFAEGRGLAAVSSRCRVFGPRRGKAMQVVVNRVFPHLRRPVLPGFNLLVHRDAFASVGGFPEVPNEDTAFSRRLARNRDTAYHPDVLVETHGRRFGTHGLSGALLHYLALDLARISATD
jgi:glycosyltransferase involved in cell wall biosynthesis